VACYAFHRRSAKTFETRSSPRSRPGHCASAAAAGRDRPARRRRIISTGKVMIARPKRPVKYRDGQNEWMSFGLQY
jgi:hypothetical protein